MAMSFYRLMKPMVSTIYYIISFYFALLKFMWVYRMIKLIFICNDIPFMQDAFASPFIGTLKKFHQFFCKGHSLIEPWYDIESFSYHPTKYITLGFGMFHLKNFVSLKDQVFVLFQYTIHTHMCVCAHACVCVCFLVFKKHQSSYTWQFYLVNP